MLPSEEAVAQKVVTKLPQFMVHDMKQRDLAHYIVLKLVRQKRGMSTPGQESDKLGTSLLEGGGGSDVTELQLL